MISEEKKTTVDKPKLCPLMSINRGDFFPCLRRCGWYNPHRGECVIQELARGLTAAGLKTILREYLH